MTTPKILYDMPMQEYLGHPAVGSSTIRRMGCPAEVKASPVGGTSKAKSLGTAVHKWILERGDVDKEYYLDPPNIPKRSAADRQAWADWMTEQGAEGDLIIASPAGEWNDLFYQQTGKAFIQSAELDAIKGMAESVMAHRGARAIATLGDSEVSIFWQDQETGLDLKIRPDSFCAESKVSPVTLDIKTIGKYPTDKNVRRAISDYGYDVSAAMYLDGVGEWAQTKFGIFVWIFVSSIPPYPCRIIRLDQDSRRDAEEKYRAYLRRYAECIASGKWPGFEDSFGFSLKWER